MIRRAHSLAIVGLLFGAPAWPCTIVVDADHPRLTPEELVAQADAIVLASVVRQIRAPVPFERFRTLPHDEQERFDMALLHGIVELEVIETLRGAVDASIFLEGTTTDHDDYNRGFVPYTGVRPSGAGGSCFAYDYQQGGTFLLLLKKTKAGAPTPYWAALQPTNEQVVGAGDPWVVWVRQRLAPR